MVSPRSWPVLLSVLRLIPMLQWAHPPPHGRTLVYHDLPPIVRRFNPINLTLWIDSTPCVLQVDILYSNNAKVSHGGNQGLSTTTPTSLALSNGTYITSMIEYAQGPVPGGGCLQGLLLFLTSSSAGVPLGFTGSDYQYYLTLAPNSYLQTFNGGSTVNAVTGLGGNSVPVELQK